MNDELVDLLRTRARATIAAFTGTPREVTTSADLAGIARALAPLMPSDDDVDVSGYRLEGRVHLDGSGHVIDSFPYGGSVIEGYHMRLTVVLASGAVVLAEQEDLWPSAGPATVYGDVDDRYFDSPAR
ncbi:MAG TPA: hypothetical protein VM261_26685 [Kofleriaceae bacterium]|nr:hypothetical protein [Kofleriaceae bacterium]